MTEDCHSPRFLHILDTSAIRHLKRVQLQEIGKRVQLAISPYTVLELLAHLSAGDFLRYKAELAKLQDVAILMFPRTELFCPPADESAQLHWKFLRDAMPAILLCAQKADSYCQFACSSVPFGPAHGMLSLRDLDSRVKEDLESLKNGYSDFIEEIIQDLTRYERSSLETPDEQRFVAHVKDAMRPSLEALIEINPDIDEGAYYDRLYPHFSFLILRALRYAQKRREAPRFKVDKNDYVDSNLCLHLDIQAPRILVTQDKALLGDLSWALNSIKVVHAYTPECRTEDVTSLLPSEPTA
jgi:hypothetical protein